MNGTKYSCPVETRLELLKLLYRHRLGLQMKHRNHFTGHRATAPGGQEDAKQCLGGTVAFDAVFRAAVGGSLNRLLIVVCCYLLDHRSVLFIEWLLACATFQHPSTEVGSRKGPRNLPRSTQANASVLGEVSPSL